MAERSEKSHRVQFDDDVKALLEKKTSNKQVFSLEEYNQLVAEVKEASAHVALTVRGYVGPFAA